MPISIKPTQFHIRTDDGYDSTPTLVQTSGTGGQGVSDDLKQALLQLAQKTAYIDDQGAVYYKALHDALYPPRPVASLTAVYTQSGTVWSDDSLDSLKAGLTVTSSYADGTSAVIDPADYSLSGSLDAAESTVTVTYAGKTAAFSVTVTPVGDTEYASNVRNFRLSSESGSSGMGADYFWLKCTDSTMISSYTSWAFDSKKTLWDTVKGKRLRVRVSLMSPDWTGEAWEKNCIMASFGIFSSAGITGGSGRQKWHRLGNIYDLPSAYTTYEFVLDATLENMDAGTGTPTASSTCGLILYSQTLNELRCNAVSVREVLST